MTEPEGVCVAFDDAVLAASLSWTRLDDPAGVNVVESWSVDRGRNKETDKTTGGSARVQIVDRFGVTDPTNSGGPFAGRIDPVKQAAIALLNPVTDEWSTLIRGYSDWSYDIDINTGFKVIEGTLQIDDGFDILSILEMLVEEPLRWGEPHADGAAGDIYFPHNQQVDDRMIQALDQAGWAPSMRRIYSGNVALQAVTYSRRDQLLVVLFDGADAEFPGTANVYMSKNGVVTFHGRFARFDPFNPDYDALQWYVGDAAAAVDPNVVPISGLSFRRSKQDVINAAVSLPMGVSSDDVPGALYKDDASIAQFGWRPITLEGLHTFRSLGPSGNNAVEETRLFAEYYVENFKQAQTRVTRIRFRPKPTDHPNAAALWDFMCNVEIGDVVNLKTTHPGGGGFDEEFFVEGVHYDAKALRVDMHDVTLDIDVSPRVYYGTDPF